MSNLDRNTDNDWRRVSEEDPYWGVLSQDQFRKDVLDDARIQEFMQTGEKYVENLMGLIHAHFDSAFQPQSVLDYGCGVGRLLIPFAKEAKRAVGVDIAERMLELCRERSLAAGAENIELVLADDELSKVDGAFDLVNCYIVLQHIPPPRGYRIIRQLISKLRPGGVGSLQLTYAKGRKFWPHEQGRGAFYRRDGDQIVDLVETGGTLPEGTIQMYDYDLNHVMAILSLSAGQPIVALPTGDDDHLGVHFVFVRAR